MAKCIALVLAGGSGSRLGHETPKQYLALGGKPMIRRTLEAFLRHPRVDGVRAVIRPEDADLYTRAIQGLDLPPPVFGGATRQVSGYNGLKSLTGDAPHIVLIHDAARPFVDHATIDRVIDALVASPAALPAVPVVDTLKRAAAGGNGVGETVSRDGLWRAQTPQGFRYGDILAAHEAAQGNNLTDDTAVAEHAGLPISLVMGHEDNIKVTTMEDLARAERHIAGAMGSFRTGSGFDVHKFCPGDHVMLCGIKVPHEFGLEGHSDADAGMHALTDAILGAIAAGDIGAHFPPTDPRWKGAASDVFLRHAAGLVTDKGGEIVNVDVTIICERPKVGPHREAMVARLAEVLGIADDRVSVKATTTEGLGFAGRREGIAAQAIATLRLP